MYRGERGWIWQYYLWNKINRNTYAMINKNYVLKRIYWSTELQDRFVIGYKEITDEVERLKKKRKKSRVVVTKFVNKIKAALEGKDGKIYERKLEQLVQITGQFQ